MFRAGPSLLEGDPHEDIGGTHLNTRILSQQALRGYHSAINGLSGFVEIGVRLELLLQRFSQFRCQLATRARRALISCTTYKRARNTRNNAKQLSQSSGTAAMGSAATEYQSL